jgi:hypothetical protein
MASKIINGTSGSLTGYAATLTIDAAADYLLIQQGGAGVYKSINRNNLLGITGSPLGTTDTQNVANKTLDNTNTITLKDTLFTLQDDGDTSKQAKFQLSGITTATTRTYTLPNASSTLADIATAQTFTNKTFTSPVITGGSIDSTTITVDSISGHTSAAIVTVGGVQLNNGVIGTASAVTTTALADSSVTPAKLLTGTGSGWSWTSWTPTWTSFTVGNAVQTCKYAQIGKTIICRLAVTLGNTSSMGTAPIFTLPVTAVSYPNIATDLDMVGICFHNAGGTTNWAPVALADTTTGRLYLAGSAGSYTNITDITASVPGVWTNGNIITSTFIYEAA